jgi:hypothetical protein
MKQHASRPKSNASYNHSPSDLKQMFYNSAMVTGDQRFKSPFQVIFRKKCLLVWQSETSTFDSESRSATISAMLAHLNIGK